MQHRLMGITATIVLVLTLLVSIAALAMAQPPAAQISGSATLDGADSPGSTVQAKVGTQVVDTATVIASSNYYMYIPDTAFPTGMTPEGVTFDFYVDGYLGGTNREHNRTPCEINVLKRVAELCVDGK